ncbi:MAG TPA: hypothetical protein VN325_04180 [Steroidobacteraceae bacterium]|nr:hypothetical protein [Steroidobacteraceae bacterium]
MPNDEAQLPAADSADQLIAPLNGVAEALRNGPIGALVVASIAVGLLFIGWMIFYFCLFLPRGAIG